MWKSAEGVVALEVCDNMDRGWRPDKARICWSLWAAVEELKPQNELPSLSCAGQDTLSISANTRMYLSQHFHRPLQGSTAYTAAHH